MSRSIRSGLLLLLVGVLLAACTPLLFDASPTLPPQYGAIPGLSDVGSLPLYRLDLVLDVDERRLLGRQEVTVPNHTGVDLSKVVFRLYPNLPQYGGRLDVGPVWIDGQRGTSELHSEDTTLAIPLSRTWAPETSVTISLTFSIELPQPTDTYALFGYSQGVWSLPDAYPLLAVHDTSLGLTGAGAGWREDIAPAHGDAVFAEAALYDVTLTLPQDLTLVTTGSVVSDTLSAAGQRVYHIVGGPLREFAWLASADFESVETTAYGVILHSYYLPGDASAGQAALNTAAAALRTYADIYGPYPFAEMIVVEAPLSYYGMEYSGLNLIGKSLYREQRAELEDRVAHEIAHQWWYAQVGNDQVNTPWLDEGLAEHSTALYYQQIYGEARANTLINQRWLVPYQVTVENGQDAVVNQPSTAFGDEYEVIVYAKAALFFEALRQVVGDETYHAILREYLTRYRWRIATPEGFLQVAESVSGRDLDALYYHWILGKQ